MSATMLYSSLSIYVVLAIFVTITQNFCNGVSLKIGRNSTDDNKTHPEITIPQGTVRGANMVTQHNRSIFGFVGIPYAQPPIGNLRFVAPKPAGTWNGTLDASKVTNRIVCPQYDDKGILEGTEDCLYLHVYTPKLSLTGDATLLPVMVYLIGGGFKTVKNSPLEYGPHFLLDGDVVLVVPNFRVGVLGYLSTGDEVSPGNYGLKDAVQALKWTQENIQYFGGDPNQVTLFGGSSGSISVELLALSNSTKGLFHKLITQSGSALSFDVNHPREMHKNQSIHLGKYFGCQTNTSALLVSCLRSINVSQILDTNFLFYVWNAFPMVVWGPGSEPNIEGALLTDEPANLVTSGNMPDVPRLSTITWDEGLATAIKFYENPDLFEEFLEKIDSALPAVLNYNNSHDNDRALTAALKSFYFNDLTANRSVLLANLTKLIGDGLFIYNAHSMVQQQLLVAKSPQYFGVLKYHGTFSYSYALSGGSTEYTGVPHGDEIIYIFHNYYSRYGPPDAHYTEVDLKMVDTMVQLWTSFATNGTPTTSESNVIWEPYSSRNNYLRLGNGSDTALEMQRDLFIERMNFWKELDAALSNAFCNSLQALAITLCLCLLSYM